MPDDHVTRARADSGDEISEVRYVCPVCRAELRPCDVDRHARECVGARVPAVTRVECEAQVAAALAEGERQARERGKRDGLLLALERVERIAADLARDRQGDPTGAALEVAERIEQIVHDLLEAHPAPRGEGGD